jgi:hypothetical protein
MKNRGEWIGIKAVVAFVWAMPGLPRDVMGRRKGGR